MALTKVRGAGAEGLTLSSTALTVANGLTLTDGDIAFADGHGLNFASASGDASGMASELLDDYEEGSWTPSITFGGSSTSIAYSASRRIGKYTKIGNVVEYYVHIEMSNKGSSTGAMQISGLPFAVVGDQHYIPGSVFIQAMSSLTDGAPIYRATVGSTALDCYQISSSSYSVITNSNCTNTTGVQVSGKYYIS